MKNYFSLFIATAMLITSTASFAGSNNKIDSFVRDYQINVKVNNLDDQEALKRLSSDIIENNITKQELINHIKAKSSDKQFSQFLAMLKAGNEQIDTTMDIDSDEFSYILSEVFNSVEHDNGANYMGTGQSCSGGVAIGFGVAAVTVAIILAYKIYQHENSDNGTRLDYHNSNGEDMLRKKKIAAGVAGGIGALLIIGGATSCR